MFSICLRTTVIVVLLSCFAGPAFAQTSRIYFAGYMGLNNFPKQDYSEGTTPASGEVEYRNGIGFAGALGLRITPQFRLEFEGGYRKTDLNRLNLSSGTSGDVGGEIRTYTGMLNGYYDFDVNWKNLQPFVSAGLGFAFHDGEVVDIIGNTTDASEDAYTLAWQMGGGLKYRIDKGLAFTGSYRLLGTTDIAFGGTDLGYSSHEIRLGVEYDLPVK